MDVARFHELAGWFEFHDGRSRFEAETLAADRIGYKRHEVRDEISKRNTQGGGNLRSADERHSANDLPGMQSAQTKEIRPMPVRDVHAGRDRVELLALSA